MTSIICTLFESDYHYGVAALANSLYYQGYRGVIFAGYRGLLPLWSTYAEYDESLGWDGAKTLSVTEGLKISFLPLDTNYHLTNYKPDFMLRLWRELPVCSEHIYYFDPDIVTVSPWSMFEDWVACGVALCEDVNSPLSAYHPRRVAWRNYFSNKGIFLKFKNELYANGGFVGVTKQDLEFLDIWKKVQEAMAPVIGGLERSIFSGYSLPQPFDRTDQDALNAAVEAWEGKVSIIGKEGMAFKAGGALIPHALGQPKPWNRNAFIKAMHGYPPRLVDREFWKNSKGPIVPQALSIVQRKLFAIKIASFFGRFYRKQ